MVITIYSTYYPVSTILFTKSAVEPNPVPNKPVTCPIHATLRMRVVKLLSRLGVPAVAMKASDFLSPIFYSNDLNISPILHTKQQP